MPNNEDNGMFKFNTPEDNKSKKDYDLDKWTAYAEKSDSKKSFVEPKAYKEPNKIRADHNISVEEIKATPNETPKKVEAPKKPETNSGSNSSLLSFANNTNKSATENKPKTENTTKNNGGVSLSQFKSSPNSSPLLSQIGNVDDDFEYEEDYYRNKSNKKTTDKNSNNNNGKKKKNSRVKKIVLSAILIALITICLVISVFSVYVFAVIDDDIGFDLNNLEISYTSIIYAKNQKTGEYEEYYKLHGTENRVWVDSSEFSPYLEDAIVSIEDKRFYSHEGVDWKRTFSAFANMFVDVYGGVQGGSTITQQLVKNLTGDKEQTPQRKMQEIMRARNIEKNYTKATILECYANTVHFGNGCDGIQVAAQYYFGKDAKDLSLLECASLAATIQTPASINPKDGPESNKKRRELCLKEMLDQKFITQEEYDKAMSETLVLADHSSSSDDATSTKSNEIYNYFIETLIDDVAGDLVNKKGYTEEEASKAILSGGLQVYSTVNTDIQETMESVFADSSNFSKVGKGEEQPQAAMTIMDYCGHVVGIMGGRGEKTGNRTLNRATSSPRQPGSSIKPLGAYSPAIENNIATYSSFIQDKPIKLADGTQYPNKGSGSSVTLVNALSQSLNCVAVRLVNSVGIETCFDFVKNRYHISTAVESYTREDGVNITDYTLSSLALGGMVNGATTLEMAAAYATFGNLGIYWEPNTYTKIVNTFGETVIEEDEHGTQAITPETADVMNKILRTPVTGSNGTATNAAIGSWPIIAKTGTTNDNYDRWFVGGTPYYIAACWYGFDMPSDMGSTKYNPCVNFWKPIMQKIHKNLSLCDFNESDDVSYRYYCTSTGLLATSGCPSVALGYYKNSYLPVCSSHGGSLRSAISKPKPTGGKYVDINISDILTGTESKVSTVPAYSHTSSASSATSKTTSTTSTTSTASTSTNTASVESSASTTTTASTASTETSSVTTSTEKTESKTSTAENTSTVSKTESTAVQSSANND